MGGDTIGGGGGGVWGSGDRAHIYIYMPPPSKTHCAEDSDAY